MATIAEQVVRERQTEKAVRQRDAGDLVEWIHDLEDQIREGEARETELQVALQWEIMDREGRTREIGELKDSLEDAEMEQAYLQEQLSDMSVDLADAERTIAQLREQVATLEDEIERAEDLRRWYS